MESSFYTNYSDVKFIDKLKESLVYAYVTVIKDKNVKEALKYADGYIDADTFQWESENSVTEKTLSELKNSKCAYIFVRKVEDEDGITLPFTYIGSGKMRLMEGSQKENGAYLFRIAMNQTAPEDIYFDFKLPDVGIEAG